MSVSRSALESNLHLPREQIAALCRKHGVEELSVFGSVLRDDFMPESDVDFLVVFKNDDYGPWMGKLTGLQEDLSALLGHKADVVPKDSLKWVIRDRVLASAEVVYVATQ